MFLCGTFYSRKSQYVIDVPFNVHDTIWVLTGENFCNNIKTEHMFALRITQRGG
jgi:hypothetical protein